VCFKDPDIGVIVEIMEESPDLPGGIRRRDFDLSPAIIYAAMSVSDLEVARSSLVDKFGLERVADDVVHPADADHLWGLAGARRDAFTVKIGNTYVEVVCYQQPRGRPKRPGYLVSDQGFMNVAMSFRARAGFEAFVAEVEAAGYGLNTNTGGQSASYATLFDQVSLEMIRVNPETEPMTGFVPRKSIMR
jgi:catechol 2,3-dioxygenase-like lactoylglutathione lyase family enzyme